MSRSAGHFLHLSIRIAAVVIATAAASAANSADVMAQIADGRAWTMQSENGRNGKLTLNPDGSAQVRMGILSMGARWQRQPDGFCLDPDRGEARCLVLRPANGGFVGLENGVVVMRLTR